MTVQFEARLEKPKYTKDPPLTSQFDAIRRLYNLPVKSSDNDSDQSSPWKKLLPSMRSYRRSLSVVETDQFKVLYMWVAEIQAREKLNEAETDAKEQFASVKKIYI